MILDSSSIVAIVLREPGFDGLKERIDAASCLVVSAATLVETHMVLTRKLGRDALPYIEALLHEAQIQVLPFAEAHWRAAAEGFLRYGKGRHSAGLNFGDCISYATARTIRMPLLFKGDDFSQTDVAR